MTSSVSEASLRRLARKAAEVESAYEGWLSAVLGRPAASFPAKGPGGGAEAFSRLDRSLDSLMDPPSKWAEASMKHAIPGDATQAAAAELLLKGTRLLRQGIERLRLEPKGWAELSGETRSIAQAAIRAHGQAVKDAYVMGPLTWRQMTEVLLPFAGAAEVLARASGELDEIVANMSTVGSPR